MPKRLGALGDELPDAAEAEDAERLLVHLDPAELAALPLAALQRRVRLRDVAHLGEQHRDRVLGRRDDVRLGRVGDDDAALGGGRHVDVVDADPGAADHLQAVGALDHVRGQLGGRADHDRVVVADRRRQLLLAPCRCSTSTSKCSPQQLDAGIGDLLLDEDPVAVLVRPSVRSADGLRRAARRRARRPAARAATPAPKVTSAPSSSSAISSAAIVVRMSKAP